MRVFSFVALALGFLSAWTCAVAAETAADWELPITDRWCDNYPGRAKECAAHVERLRQDGLKAWKGDYQGQRNVAYCLSWGCDGLVVPSPTLGCAWRLVILGSGSPKLMYGDISSTKQECGRLESSERSVARAQAEALFQVIYSRPMPPVQW